MNPIDGIFKSKPKALICYLTAGYPDTAVTIKAAKLFAENGCDLIELGIPFSDPMADGATIQKASHQALLNGVTVDRCMEAARQIAGETNIPLVFMTYYNPVLHYGTENFCRQAHTAGISGLIIPDLPPEEGGPLEAAAKVHNIDVIYLLAPTSPPARIKLVADKSQGFIYLVSVAGVTGTRQALAGDVSDFIARVRKETVKPLCVGFGISTPEQARQVALNADGVIIGSRLIQLIEEDATLASLSLFVRETRQALNQIYAARETVNGK